MTTSSRQKVTRILKDYYNTSETYLAHLQGRQPENLRPYVMEIAKVVGPGGRVLDVGCGTGISTMLMVEQGLRVCGIDLSLTFLREAESKVTADFVQTDGTQLPFADRSFDGVGTNAVIEHVPEIEAFIDELTRVIAPGGYLVIYSPNLLSPFTALKHFMQRLLKGKHPHTPFYSTAFGALLYAFEGFFRLKRKRGLKGPSFEFRRPSLEETANDFDSVFISNQVDLEKHLQSLGFQILKLAQGKGRLGRMIARLFPYYAGGIGIIARKENTIGS